MQDEPGRAISQSCGLGEELSGFPIVSGNAVPLQEALAHPEASEPVACLGELLVVAHLFFGPRIARVPDKPLGVAQKLAGIDPRRGGQALVRRVKPGLVVYVAGAAALAAMAVALVQGRRAEINEPNASLVH